MDNPTAILRKLESVAYCLTEEVEEIVDTDDGKHRALVFANGGVVFVDREFTAEPGNVLDSVIVDEQNIQLNFRPTGIAYIEKETN